MTRNSLLLCVLASLIACHSSRDPSGGEGTQELRIAPESQTHAEALHQGAKEREPDLTRLLQTLARDHGASLHGLEHRLKSVESLARKIQTDVELGKATLPANVVIEDALRYTMLIWDDPRGRYDKVTRTVLRELESRGHQVRLVKNYWPRGDTYAGLNCVLAFADGFHWELQFHTPGSLAAVQEGHDLYEILRLPGTPLTERQRLFDRLTTRWNWVLIPKGILEPKSVHAKEVLRAHKRP